jgi:sarcosine oxidase subunit alpha
LLPLPEPGARLSFTYNGKAFVGEEGDTIVSALMAAGVSIFSRSFKYHRPRGVYDYHGLGAETLLTVDGTANVLADRTYLRQGMSVEAQNCWPSPEFDVMAVNRLVVPMLPTGFYYKMFHKPKWAWPFFEKALRKVAGLGEIRADDNAHERRYEKRACWTRSGNSSRRVRKEGPPCGAGAGSRRARRSLCNAGK